MHFWDVPKSPSPFQLRRWVLTQTGPLLNVQLFSYCKLLRGALLREALRERERHTHTSISRAANLACWALSSCLSLWLTPLQGETGREGGRNGRRSESEGGITATYKHKQTFIHWGKVRAMWCGKHPLHKRIQKNLHIHVLLYRQALKSFQWFYKIHLTDNKRKKEGLTYSTWLWT